MTAVGDIVRHIAFFRTTTHRGLEIFRLLVESEDIDLDRLLRQNIHNTGNLDIIETIPDRMEVDNQIAIFDCRNHFSGAKTPTLPGLSSNITNIALIHPEPESRHSAFLIGFSDFLSWPVVAPELHTRLLAQSRAHSLRDPNYRYSRVALVERCCAYLADQFELSISVRMLAQMLNTNHNTLTYVFKREMGLPPLAWQRKLRLEAAARQLRLTDRPISAIAADYGYDLPANFATAFRRHFGITPNSYRKHELRKH